jgi:ubiquinone/menaquinone biosynthesis C-methylase UbiE
MYATDDPLSVRIQTHERYTRPQVDFSAWVLDHIPWRGDEVVLDAGCGSGAYVEPVRARLGRGGWFIGGDLSLGMLRDAAAQFPSARPDLVNADAMNLPLPPACCDVVLANHMLYHVPVIEQALAEFRRALCSGGRLIAATNAGDSMQRFFSEMTRACQALGHPFQVVSSAVTSRFNLENGAAALEPFFERVERHVLDSALVFPQAAPAIAYVDSMRSVYEPQLPPDLSWEKLMAQAERQIEAHIAASGSYRVPKTTGVFVAS